MAMFLGKELPILREGYVHALLIYPGGRKLVAQIEPYNIYHINDAVAELKAGRHVYVWLDDAVEVLQRANLPKEPPNDR